jgi:hypothetical protein
MASFRRKAIARGLFPPSACRSVRSIPPCPLPECQEPNHLGRSGTVAFRHDREACHGEEKRVGLCGIIQTV